MAERLWWSRRESLLWGVRYELWESSTPNDRRGVLHISWSHPGAPPHVALHAYARDARAPALLLNTILAWVNPGSITPEKLAWLLQTLNGTEVPP